MDNKAVVTALANKLGREPKDINLLIEGLAEIIKEQCGNMNTIAIPGFGAFEPIKEEERISKDLSTGKTLLLPPNISIAFKPSSLLRKHLSE